MDLIINYNFQGCPVKMIFEDDFVGSIAYPKPYSLNLRLKFDIQKEENKGGSFTYEEIYDENYMILDVIFYDGSELETKISEITGGSKPLDIEFTDMSTVVNQ